MSGENALQKAWVEEAETCSLASLRQSRSAGQAGIADKALVGTFPGLTVLFLQRGSLHHVQLSSFSGAVGGLGSERVCRHARVGWVERAKETKTPHAKAGRDWDYPRSVKLCRAPSGSGKTASRAQDIWGLIGTELR